MADREPRYAPRSTTAFADTSLPTLAEVCESPADFLGKLDVGTLNLMCAGGLPGAEDLDLAKQIAWLDDAAHQVDLQTRARFDEFALKPGDFNNSPGTFCCNYLLRTLQELLGVQYNPARVTDSDFQNPLCINPDFRDARDLFIHGMMGAGRDLCFAAGDVRRNRTPAGLPTQTCRGARPFILPLGRPRGPAVQRARAVQRRRRRSRHQLFSRRLLPKVAARVEAARKSRRLLFEVDVTC